MKLQASVPSSTLCSTHKSHLLLTAFSGRRTPPLDEILETPLFGTALLFLHPPHQFGLKLVGNIFRKEIHPQNYIMVQTLKLWRFALTAAAVIVSSTTAFTPAASSSASLGTAFLGTSSRPLSPTITSLQASTSSSFSSSSSSTLLERGPAIVEKRERDHHRDTHRDRSPDGDYILRIYNDNVNTREYVAVCLVQVVGLCESRAFYTMQQAHQNGIAKVGEYNQEVAECYEEQLNEKGIVCDVVSAGGE